MNSYIVSFVYSRQTVQATDSDMAIWKAKNEAGLEAGEMKSCIILSDSGRSGDELLVEEDGRARNADFTAEVAREEKIEIPEVRFIGQAAVEARDDIERIQTFASMGLDPNGKPAPSPLPPRRARGLSLSRWYCDIEHKWQFDVGRLGYGASLNCAYHEEELQDHSGNREPMQLSAADMKVIEEWQNREDEYIDQAEIETGLTERET